MTDQKLSGNNVREGQTYFPGGLKAQSVMARMMRTCIVVSDENGSGETGKVKLYPCTAT